MYQMCNVSFVENTLRKKTWTFLQCKSKYAEVTNTLVFRAIWFVRPQAPGPIMNLS